jgi:hypothetical protein
MIRPFPLVLLLAVAGCSKKGAPTVTVRQAQACGIDDPRTATALAAWFNRHRTRAVAIDATCAVPRRQAAANWAKVRKAVSAWLPEIWRNGHQIGHDHTTFESGWK